jgi:VanZ family protein
MLSVVAYRILFWLLLVAVLILSLVSVGETRHLFVGQDKLHHTLAYSALYILLIQAYNNRFGLWTLALSLATFGLLVEVLQFFTSYRQAEVLDFVANSLGIFLVASMLRYLQARR